MSRLRWILVLGIASLILVSSLFLIPRPSEGNGAKNGQEPGSPERLFPFYLPWDDSEETIPSLSRWIEKPAGSRGYVYVGDDGHLYVGDKRIRFLGINICDGAAFPKKEDAEKIAARQGLGTCLMADI